MRMKQLIENEYENPKKFNHKNIIKMIDLFDSVKSDKFQSTHIVMELCDYNLSDFISKHDLND